jgi:hypothetical protein
MHLFAFIILLVIVLIFLLNKLSYILLKTRIFGQKKWDLNICCGKMDGGGINADIVKHSCDMSNFLLINNIYSLPFKNKQFNRIVCSHTIEHVDDPERFDKELQRIGHRVHYIVPPLWDIGAAFNLWEHKWIFLTFKKEHTRLPRYTRLPFSKVLHKQFNQRIIA